MHIFTKMNDISPYQIVADFMNQYEQIIAPRLKEGKLEDVRFLLYEQTMRSEDVIKQNLPPMKENGAYANYRMIIQYLGGLAEEKNVTTGLLKSVLISVDRFSADLDLILSENPQYKQLREN